MDERFYETVNKYGTAFMLLYPKQSALLKRALEHFFHTGENIKIKDPFVRLAYEMVVCDYYWQKQREEGV